MVSNNSASLSQSFRAIALLKVQKLTVRDLQFEWHQGIILRANNVALENIRMKSTPAPFSHFQLRPWVQYRPLKLLRYWMFCYWCIERFCCCCRCASILATRRCWVSCRHVTAGQTTRQSWLDSCVTWLWRHAGDGRKQEADTYMDVNW